MVYKIFINMKLLEVLFESSEDRMIAKAKQVYKAFKKGRGMVIVSWFPPVDVSYELPDINRCNFEIKPSWENEDELVPVITMLDPVKFKIHNLEEVFDEGADEERVIRTYDISFVYRKKFDQFNIFFNDLF